MSCQTVRSISDGFASKARKANRALTGLQVTAELLEDQVNFSDVLVDPTSLIDPSVLTIDTLVNLQASCPGLGLPASPGVADLQAMQARLRNAYFELYEKINLSPLLKLDRFQAKLNELKTRIALTAQEIQNYLTCAAAACDSSETLTAELEAKTAEVETYTENFINGTGQIMTDTAKNAADSLNETATLLNGYSVAP